ncbi:MAG: ABC transporter ATP-binding protein [Hyphomicrobiaceae bacterium]
MTLRARDVGVALGGRRILSGVTLACGAGRITGIIGPNGAGKSTIMRALAGLVPLIEGAIDFDGTEISARPVAARGRLLAYLPQDRAVHWPLSVRRVVGLGRLPIRNDGGRDAVAHSERVVDAALRSMDVDHLADRPVSELSGGELARVLFARALAQEAPVILADEPTAGLDPAHALGLFEVLGRLAADGRTIVVALHDLSLAARFCHEVVMMASGSVVASGSPAETLTDARLQSVFGARMAVGSVGGVPVVVPVEPLSSREYPPRV